MSCKPTYKGKRYNSLSEIKSVILKENSVQTQTNVTQPTLFDNIAPNSTELLESVDMIRDGKPRYFKASEATNIRLNKKIEHINTKQMQDQGGLFYEPSIQNENRVDGEYSTIQLEPLVKDLNNLSEIANLVPEKMIEELNNR